MTTEYENRYAIGRGEAKGYDTEQLREAFLVDNLMAEDKVVLTYTHYERFIVGSAVPVNGDLTLETIDALKAENFLVRRELGIINVGGEGVVTVGEEKYQIKAREALYIGCGSHEVSFASVDSSNPAKFYLNSTPAHHPYPTKLVTKEDANVLELGSLETSNHRFINQLIIHGIVETCQLQMGLTELQSGSVWNTMPAHQHDRRNEVYFYFDLDDSNAVSHFMGEPTETRVIWVNNEQAVVCPPWSIHCGAGTRNYSFVWGMGGENLDYGDMDHHPATALR